MKKIERTEKYVDNDENVGNNKKTEIGQFIKLGKDHNLSKIEWNKSDLQCFTCNNYLPYLGLINVFI